MRILQLIDSLRPGGAERMAVTYANALNGRIEASYLCCTRLEGKLRKNLAPEVGYLFLKKKSALDIKAIFRLRRYIKDNKITIIQAHSTSFFLAVLVKILLPEVKLVWHDHFGERALENKKAGILKPASKYFDAVISVNSDLANWSRTHLDIKEILYVKNFVSGHCSIRTEAELRGEDTFKIICLANLRKPKNHLNLLEAFILLKGNKSSTLHLVGKDEEDFYSHELKEYIRKNNLGKNVFLYGAQENVDSLLKQADLGVLASSSEGLPVALLEYGFAGLPVVCTRVGQCAEVIGKYGLVVPPRDPQALAGAIQVYLEDGQKRSGDSRKFRERILNNYSEEVVIPEVLGLFEKILKS